MAGGGGRGGGEVVQYALVASAILWIDSQTVQTHEHHVSARVFRARECVLRTRPSSLSDNVFAVQYQPHF